MPRIQCLLGPVSDVYVGGTAYNFTLDEHGRAIADVPNQVHAQCFLTIQHYRLVPDDMVLGDGAPTTKGKGKAKSSKSGKSADDDANQSSSNDTGSSDDAANGAPASDGDTDTDKQANNQDATGDAKPENTDGASAPTPVAQAENAGKDTTEADKTVAANEKPTTPRKAKKK